MARRSPEATAVSALSHRRSLLALAVLLILAAPSLAPSEEPSARWLTVDYGRLVDRRKLTHSGEPVGSVLQRPADALARRLLDPILEPYAFVLPDALDALAPPPDPPMVEVGALWEPGESQPAWVELVRSRRLLLESDGDGHLRACLPSASLEASAETDSAPPVDPTAAAQEAWEDAWPILRHALAGERRRLAALRGGEFPTLEVEVHAYRHRPASSTFVLGAAPWRTKVSDTGPRPGARALDLEGLRSILERGLQVEGGRLEPSGRLRWLVSEPDAKPTILGRSPSLADLAVAYRAVARGGYGEPYMSLDRASSPQIADVNYGGRLRDTALGMVSLLSDVRFKTFSVGVDLLGAGDVRDTIRRSMPEFRTHLERFAADPTAGAVLNQQTRFWFYPDGVDLTLSEEGDVLAFRKVRMTAASERVVDAGAASADPPWTRETVAFLNAHYDQLSILFPEMAELDESVRWLSVFTWLDAARARGLPVPDLDVLLALELPAAPTPRRFPQLLSYDALPKAGGAGVVDVVDRTSVGEALDRLEPAGGKPLPAITRFRRSLSMLNPQIPDQAALASEMESKASSADTTTLDLFSYRAERLLMHTRVLATLPATDRALVEARRAADPGLRVFSIGIGGVDLGTGAILARAAGRGSKLGLGSSSAKPSSAPAPPAASRAGAPTATAADPPGLPSGTWPDHGLGPVGERATISVADGRGTIVSRRRPGSLVRKGTWKVADGKTVAWEEFVLDLEGPEARARRRVPEPDGTPPTFTRLEDGRYLTYRFERSGGTLRAAPATGRLPDAAFGPVADPTAAPAAIPAALTVMNLVPSASPGLAGESAEPPTLTVRVRGADGRDRSAAIPRPLLQRLVVGRDADLTPAKPLQAFTPASQILGSTRVVMLTQPVEATQAPWAGPVAQRPGEEDPRRLAAALNRWWAADPESASAAAVVGVDAAASPARWAAAPALDGGVSWIAPEDAFPATASVLRSALPAATFAAGASRLCILVSAEPPGVLGRRLRRMASDPAYAGKLVAVLALGGPLREDLPASLLGEGRWAALGVFEAGPVGLSKAIDRAVAWARSGSGETAKGRRVEEIPGPFTWYY